MKVKIIGWQSSSLWLALFVSLFSPLLLWGQTNTLELESTFKGNQEQPTVLYIVPWKSIKAPAASYKPLKNLLQQNYALIDRNEFRRELNIRQLSHSRDLSPIKDSLHSR